jgi:predicted DNA-binding transcriptional regulator AlpA
MEQLDLIVHIKETLELQCKQCPHCSVTEQQNSPVPSRMLTAKEVQERFAIVHSTYYRWIARGWLVPSLIGGKHYYEASEIDKLQKGRKYRERGGMDGG